MSAPNTRTGQQLGPYRIGKLLGRGGMGEVYEAYDTTKERTVALKLLPPQYIQSAEFRDRFERESRTAARLSDPHIIPIHDFGEIDGLLFIDMRLVDGRDLRAVLADGPLDPARAVALLSQIAGALDAAHRNGLVHRDVKPDNILVDGEDFAYLVDFGIAHGTTDPRYTMVGTALGSLAYMAPERFDDAPAGPPADIYSLACVLYESITGHTPFESNSDQALMTSHITKPPPTTGGPLDPVIAKGMAKNPAERYSGAREMMRAAAAALSAPTTPMRGPAPGLAPRPGPPATPPPGIGSGPTVVGPLGGAATSGPTMPRGLYGRPDMHAAQHPSGPQGSWPAGPPAPAGGGGASGPPPSASGPQSFSGPWSPGGPPPKKPGRGRMIAVFSIIGVAVVALAVTAVVLVSGGGDSPPPGPATSSSTPVAAATCEFHDTPVTGPKAPKPAAQQPDTGTVDVTMNTTAGSIGLELDRAKAPCNVGAIVSLTKSGFYDNTTCHRVGDGYLICGDPTGGQDSNPGWSSPDEFPTDLVAAGGNDDKGRPLVTYPRGSIAVVNVDPPDRKDPKQTFAASAFFMLTKPVDQPAAYTIVGTVDDAGLAVLDRVVAAGYVPAKPDAKYGRPSTPVIVTTATVQ
ncbi:protein kinase domain-containing protein [Gordonia sp. NPDC003429]